MPEIKILKPEIFQEVETNLELRKEIAKVEFVQQNSVRMLARNKSEKLTRYNILCVIKKFLKLKSFEEMFNTKKLKT